MKNTLENKFALVDDHIIGVWKFRQRGKKPVWCATYQFDGYYYDTLGKLTIDSALEQVQKDLEKLNKAKKKKIK